jgi:leucyl-tRNA synthetase
LEPFVQVLAPFAPHIGEELWARLGHPETLTFAPWPSFDEAWCVDAVITLSVQVNGKLRGTVELPPDADEATAVAAAREVPNVARFLEDLTVRKAVFVRGRMVNFVAN